jgi:hypothetical protein
MASKSATKQDLQQACRDLGLDSHGNKATLLKRLGKHAKSAAASASHDEEPESDTECDAVLATKIDIGGEEEMRQSGKDALQQELVTRELDVEEAGGKLMVGNRRGLSLAGRLAVLENTVVELKTKSAEQDATIAAQDARNASLEGQVAGLTASVDAYKSVRNRFISTYKRDVLQNDTAADRLIIAAGNVSAHGGDAVIDALLYKQGARSDYSVYKKLYGVNPGTVEFISECDMH